MDVGRAPAVATQTLQQLADGPVVGDGVGHGLDALEPDAAVLVGDHDAALRRPFAGRVLHVIMTFAVRLPDVDLDAGHGLACLVHDAAQRQHGLAVGVARHGRAVAQRGGVVRVERPQHGALGRAGGLGVVDAVDEQRQAQDVGQQDELVAHVAADLAGGDEEVYGGHPLLGAQARLARKIVQVRDEARHEVAQARVGRLVIDADGVGRDVVDGEVEQLRRVGGGSHCAGGDSVQRAEDGVVVVMGAEVASDEERGAEEGRGRRERDDEGR